MVFDSMQGVPQVTIGVLHFKLKIKMPTKNVTTNSFVLTSPTLLQKEKLRQVKSQPGSGWELKESLRRMWVY
jgi:hypothetical protein